MNDRYLVMTRLHWTVTMHDMPVELQKSPSRLSY